MFLVSPDCSYLIPWCASNCVFTYFGILGSHYNSSVGLVKYRLQNVNHSTSMHTGRYLHQSWISGLFSSTAEISGFLVYQLRIIGIVLYYWISLRCIKSWIVIYYRGLKFPHSAVVLLPLVSDGACTGLNGHCARKTAVLILVWCYKARGDREQDLWSYWLKLH